MGLTTGSQKSGVLGINYSLNSSFCICNPKRYILSADNDFWSISRENQPARLSRVRMLEIKIQETRKKETVAHNFTNIVGWWDDPHQAIAMIYGKSRDLDNVIQWAKFGYSKIGKRCTAGRLPKIGLTHLKLTSP